jgi:tRNA pseudouridine-54 N-methylase
MYPRQKVGMPTFEASERSALETSIGFCGFQHAKFRQTEPNMSFWKKIAASILEGCADDIERKRNYANKVLATKGDQLTDVQRQKVETYAYTDHHNTGREMAKKLRESDSD